MAGDVLTTQVMGPYGEGNIYYNTCAILGRAHAVHE
jgi:hypothetical protein